MSFFLTSGILASFAPNMASHSLNGAISEPLVKVLCLVDGEKPAMGYLYEAMDRAKESIHAYYEDKGDEKILSI